MNRYSDRTLGYITSIDVTNPLKIAVFYYNQTQIVFLDNTLSKQTQKIALETTPYDQTQLVCSSINSGVWLFDQRSFQLVRLSEKLVEIQKTINIAQLVGKSIEPSLLSEKNNWVYLYDKNLGLLVFDIFGTYLKTIPIKNAKNIQVTDEAVFYEEEKQLIRYDFKENTFYKLSIPATEYKTLWVMGKKIFILTSESIIIYTIKM